MIAIRLLCIAALSLTIAACASKKVEPYARPAPQSALPPAAEGAFAAIETAIRNRHGAEASGFELLDRNEDGLRWRLALIDSAITERYMLGARWDVAEHHALTVEVANTTFGASPSGSRDFNEVRLQWSAVYP